MTTDLPVPSSPQPQDQATCTNSSFYPDPLSFQLTYLKFRPVWLSLWEVFLHQTPKKRSIDDRFCASVHSTVQQHVTGDFPYLNCRHKYVNLLLHSTGPRGGVDCTGVLCLILFLGASETRWTIISSRCCLGEVARPQREPDWTQTPAVSRMAYGLPR